MLRGVRDHTCGIIGSRTQTAPIIEYYGKRGVPVQPFDGARPIDEVQHDILAVIDR